MRLGALVPFLSLSVCVATVNSGAKAVVLPLSNASLMVTIGGTGGAPASTLTETWNGTDR